MLVWRPRYPVAYSSEFPAVSKEISCCSKTSIPCCYDSLSRLRNKCCTWVWAAQRFAAAITGLFSEPALAAEVRLRRGKYFFRRLIDCESLYSHFNP